MGYRLAYPVKGVEPGEEGLGWVALRSWWVAASVPEVCCDAWVRWRTVSAALAASCDHVSVFSWEGVAHQRGNIAR